MHRRKLSQFKDNWDDDFNGDLLIPDHISQGNQKLDDHLQLVKRFAESSKRLETLLLSIPETNVNTELLNDQVVVESLDLVAIAHEDTEADFFKSKVGTIYRQLRHEPQVLSQFKSKKCESDQNSSFGSKDENYDFSDGNKSDDLLSVDSYVLRGLTDQSNLLVDKLKATILKL